MSIEAARFDLLDGQFSAVVESLQQLDVPDDEVDSARIEADRSSMLRLARSLGDRRSLVATEHWKQLGELRGIGAWRDHKRSPHASPQRDRLVLVGVAGFVVLERAEGDWQFHSSAEFDQETWSPGHPKRALGLPCPLDESRRDRLEGAGYHRGCKSHSFHALRYTSATWTKIGTHAGIVAGNPKPGRVRSTCIATVDLEEDGREELLFAYDSMPYERRISVLRLAEEAEELREDVILGGLKPRSEVEAEDSRSRTSDITGFALRRIARGWPQDRSTPKRANADWIVVATSARWDYDRRGYMARVLRWRRATGWEEVVDHALGEMGGVVRIRNTQERDLFAALRGGRARLPDRFGGRPEGGLAPGIGVWELIGSGGGLLPLLSWSAPLIQRTKRNFHDLVAVDFNGDGTDELAALGYEWGKGGLELLAGSFSSDGQLECHAIDGSIDGVGESTSLSVADFPDGLGEEIVYLSAGRPVVVGLHDENEVSQQANPGVSFPRTPWRGLGNIGSNWLLSEPTRTQWKDRALHFDLVQKTSRAALRVPLPRLANRLSVSVEVRVPWSDLLVWGHIIVHERIGLEERGTRRPWRIMTAARRVVGRDERQILTTSVWNGAGQDGHGVDLSAHHYLIPGLWYRLDIQLERRDDRCHATVDWHELSVEPGGWRKISSYEPQLIGLPEGELELEFGGDRRWMTEPCASAKEEDGVLAPRHLQMHVGHIGVESIPPSVVPPFAGPNLWESATVAQLRESRKGATARRLFGDLRDIELRRPYRSLWEHRLEAVLTTLEVARIQGTQGQPTVLGRFAPGPSTPAEVIFALSRLPRSSLSSFNAETLHRLRPSAVRFGGVHYDSYLGAAWRALLRRIPQGVGPR